MVIHDDARYHFRLTESIKLGSSFFKKLPDAEQLYDLW